MNIFNIFKKKKLQPAILDIKVPKADKIWKYINEHQDDSYATLADDLRIPYQKMVKLCINWACGDREGFEEILNQQLP